MARSQKMENFDFQDLILKYFGLKTCPDTKSKVSTNLKLHNQYCYMLGRIDL